jgi:hypothetical protein
MSVQDKIAELEREVARKKALVNAKIVLPKDTPDDVKAEVTAVITEALLKLASSGEDSKGSEIFTEDEIRVLKLLATRAQTKSATSAQQTQNNAPTVTNSLEIGEKILGKVDKNPVSKGEYVGREAEIISLDAVPVRQRGKVESMEKCKVIEEREDGYLHILTMGGVRFNIMPDNLNFDIQSN